MSARDEHHGLFDLARAFGLALVLAAIFWQSYNGRADVVRSQRAGCLGTMRSITVPQANALRADVDGNRAIAGDPRQPAATRRARRHEVTVELRALSAYDRRMDPREIAGLNAEGRAAVRRLGAHAYSCDRAYPEASPFQFFN